MTRIIPFVHPKSSEQFRSSMARIFGAVKTATASDLEDPTKINIVVCGTWENRKLEGAVRASCADCGRAIAHMPHAPAGLPKICVPCFEVRAP